MVHRGVAGNFRAGSHSPIEVKYLKNLRQVRGSWFVLTSSLCLSGRSGEVFLGFYAGLRVLCEIGFVNK
jgi:hypothetical protein